MSKLRPDERDRRSRCSLPHPYLTLGLWRTYYEGMNKTNNALRSLIRRHPRFSLAIAMALESVALTLAVIAIS